MIRLSVNVNKIAVLRNSRGGSIPDVLRAARTCIAAGCHGITVHPRPDARHITYKDVHELDAMLRAEYKTEFNIEGYPTPDFLKLVCSVKPAQATLVPDPPDAYPGESPAAAESGDTGHAVPGGADSAIADPAAGDPRAGLDGERPAERRRGRRPGAVSPGGADSRDSGSVGGRPGGGGLGGGRPGGRSAEGAGPGSEDPGSEEAARAICLRQLTAGPRTRAQLATALRKQSVPDEIAESVLSRFAEVGLIDDAAFARAWVESRHHGRGLARRALTAELRQRGIPDGEVRSAVSLLGPQDELAAARRLVAKRAPSTRGKPMPARARQLMGMLARKGYSAGLAAQVVREALELEQEQEQTGGADGGADLAWISEDGAGDDWP